MLHLVVLATGPIHPYLHNATFLFKNEFIFCSLYRLIEKQLSPDSCLTGWGRSIGIFVLNAKKQLIEAELTHRKMDGKRELLKRLLPPWKFSNALSSAKYNAHLFKEFLDEPK